MGFLLKKLIAGLLSPLVLILGILAAALVFKNHRRKLLLGGIILLYLLASKPVGYLLPRPLESCHPPVSISSLDPQVGWVVVLSGGSRQAPGLSPGDWLSDPSLRRVLEGVHLARRLPQAQLLLCGGDYRGFSVDADRMREMALELGIAPERLMIEPSSWDTLDQARFLRRRFGTEPFYLVTSAVHMPRAMGLTRRLGARPIPAPTDFRSVWTPLHFTDVFPEFYYLDSSQRALREYTGLLWSRLKGDL